MTETFAELLARIERRPDPHFDIKCWALANHFIDDHPELRPKARDLAVVIQEAVDGWLEDQAQAMVDTFHTCKVDETALFVESLTQGMTPEQRSCAAKTVTKEQVDALLVKGFSGANSDKEFAAISDALGKACKLG